LWANYQQLIAVALLDALILALWFTQRERLGRVGFYALFAVTVTAAAAVQLWRSTWSSPA